MTTTLHHRRAASPETSPPRAGRAKPAKEEVNEVDEAEKKKASFIKRCITGFSLIGVYSLIIYGGHLYVSLLVLLLQTMIFRELVNVRFRVNAEKNLPWFRTIQWCWFGVAMVYNYGDSSQAFLRADSEYGWIKWYSHYHSWVSFSLYALLFVFSVLSLKKGYYKYQMGQLTWTIVTLCLIVFQMRYVLDNIFQGLFWFFFPSALVVCNDCFAYFCGKLFGKKFVKTQFLKLSPNKTWEGFIGAFFCTLVFAFFSASWLATLPWMTCPLESLPQFFPEPLTCNVHPVFVKTAYAVPAFVTAYVPTWTHVQLFPVQLHAIVFASFTSVISPFGGFYASAIKRAYKLKDFDSLLPGHGGVMDRMDCQFITALFTAVYCSTFIWSYHTNVEAIVTSVLRLSIDEQRQILLQLQSAVTA
ncbi:phosphatidate cytidylyltransferase [Saprolegnia diclina VS20]|uniref:Phosphatidate cytidylyltransferase n=1 Tax=Saprolegnia diclina (strain VS20) TaxID=1156394 RepID=T0QGZ7_SAPDV|nr:phosphatidate cytidylyltransferase [Saprolegnia diclina VS20]EQC33991.1 phosphatidate cytidylyltransferase [Saprolegnia diclina VS20]|eukprot:XP_008612786.1 phosphatidate cytidylyltransferase [Saprolegnia diclina VS20]